MDSEIDISTVLDKINELKSSSLLPRNWVKIIADRQNVSTTIVRDWASGRKNLPDGAIAILENMSEILAERKARIKRLTSLNHPKNIN